MTPAIPSVSVTCTRDSRSKRSIELGKAHPLFGAQLPGLREKLNEVLPA